MALPLVRVNDGVFANEGNGIWLAAQDIRCGRGRGARGESHGSGWDYRRPVDSGGLETETPSRLASG